MAQRYGEQCLQKDFLPVEECHCEISVSYCGIRHLRALKIKISSALDIVPCSLVSASSIFRAMKMEEVTLFSRTSTMSRAINRNSEDAVGVFDVSFGSWNLRSEIAD